MSCSRARGRGAPVCPSAQHPNCIPRRAAAGWAAFGASWRAPLQTSGNTHSRPATHLGGQLQVGQLLARLLARHRVPRRVLLEAHTLLAHVRGELGQPARLRGGGGQRLLSPMPQLAGTATTATPHARTWWAWQPDHTRSHPAHPATHPALAALTAPTCMLIMTQVLVARPSCRPVVASVTTQSRCAASLPSSWNHVSIWTTSPLQMNETGRARAGSNGWWKAA